MKSYALAFAPFNVNYMFNENECRNSTSRSDSSEVIGCGLGISERTITIHASCAIKYTFALLWAHILKPIIMAVTSSLAKNFSRLLLLSPSTGRTKIKAWPMTVCDLTTLLARPDNVHKLQPQKQHFQVIVL